jgi:uncharacterized phiE125 gp8 family phage protein
VLPRRVPQGLAETALRNGPSGAVALLGDMPVLIASQIQRVIDDSTADEPLTLQEAKDQVRIYTDELDVQVSDAIREVRKYCEAHTGRCLRTEVTREITFDAWPSEGIRLPWPPLISVESIDYWDADNNDTEFASSNYSAQLSDELYGFIEWAPSVSFPDTYSRRDAIRVQFKCGYQTRFAVPHQVKRAMKILLSLEFDDVPPAREENARKRAKDMLQSTDWSLF